MSEYQPSVGFPIETEDGETVTIVEKIASGADGGEILVSEDGRKFERDGHVVSEVTVVGDAPASEPVDPQPAENTGVVEAVKEAAEGAVEAIKDAAS
jgi:hypothetical protein